MFEEATDSGKRKAVQLEFQGDLRNREDRGVG